MAQVSRGEVNAHLAIRLQNHTLTTREGRREDEPEPRAAGILGQVRGRVSIPEVREH